MRQVIETKLKALEPSTVNIVDESSKHVGHSGHKEGGESHFHIEICSKHFTNMSKIERHRAVYTILGDELKNKIHALSLKLYTEEERDAGLR